MSAADKLALRYVLCYFGDDVEGAEAPLFETALLVAIEEAGPDDVDRLRLVYPELVDFVLIAKRGGLDELRDAVTA